MSRIGKKPIAIPGGVTATAEDGTLTVKGPKGTLTMAMLDDVIYKVGEGEILAQVRLACEGQRGGLELETPQHAQLESEPARRNRAGMVV